LREEIDERLLKGMVLAPGTIIGGKYLLEERVGQGGMGAVWRATHLVTRKHVALKFLHGEHGEDTRLRRRFLREARAASAVRHPNVVAIHDVLQLDDGTPAMVMEFLEGESLGNKLEREQKIPLRDVCRLLLPVVSAVGTAHAAGVVHRDLKPDNIYLSKLENERRTVVKVLDFGIAKLTAIEGSAASTAALTGTGAMLGTPYYMAPEQVFGERDIDHRADIWSIGVILYECISGLRPADGDNIGQIMKAITHRTIVPIEKVCPDLPPDISDLVGKLLSVDRNERPQSLHPVQDVLRNHADLRRQEDMESLFPPPAAPPVSRNSLPDVASRPNIELDETIDAPASATLDSTTKNTHSEAVKPKLGGKRIAIGVGAVAILAIAGSRFLPRHTETVQPVIPSHDVPSAHLEVATSAPAVDTDPPFVPAASAPAPSASSTSKPPRPVRSASSTSAATATATAHPSTTASASPTTSSSYGGLVEKPPY
jgi:serine/threonine protein kinase